MVQSVLNSGIFLGNTCFIIYIQTGFAYSIYSNKEETEQWVDSVGDYLSPHINSLFPSLNSEQCSKLLKWN